MKTRISIGDKISIIETNPEKGVYKGEIFTVLSMPWVFEGKEVVLLNGCNGCFDTKNMNLIERF